MEVAVPVCQSGHTLKLSADSERVQQVAISIMLDDVSYEPACALLGLKPMHVRRLELCARFVVTSTNCRHKDLFKLLKDWSHYTRFDENKFMP